MECTQKLDKTIEGAYIARFSLHKKTPVSGVLRLSQIDHSALTVSAITSDTNCAPASER